MANSPKFPTIFEARRELSPSDFRDLMLNKPLPAETGSRRSRLLAETSLADTTFSTETRTNLVEDREIRLNPMPAHLAELMELQAAIRERIDQAFFEDLFETMTGATPKG